MKNNISKKEIVAKYVVGYKKVEQKVGKVFGGSKDIVVAEYLYNGERGTLGELGKRHGLTNSVVFNRIASGTPLDKELRKRTKHLYKGKMMWAKDIADETGIAYGTICGRISRGDKELDKDTDRNRYYTFVDLDGKTRSASTTDICRYYAKYHNTEYTERIWNKVRNRLKTSVNDGKMFVLRDLFNDELYWHRKGTRIGEMKPSIV